jgi:hypothetical protein
MAQTRRLSPDEAKAILVARAAGVDMNSPGGSRGAGPDLTFEVFQTADGWYVYCYGGYAGNGSTVHIDSTWNAGKVTFGPPPLATVGPTSQP